MPAPRGMSDPLVQLAEAAEAHNTPILHNPLAAKHKTPLSAAPNVKVPSPSGRGLG